MLSTLSLASQRSFGKRFLATCVALLSLGLVCTAQIVSPSLGSSRNVAVLGSPKPPTVLRVDQRGGVPLIDIANPRYAWHFRHGRRGALQTAYQILVASELSLLKPQLADVWNSGRVFSDNSTSVLHNGTPLDSDERYHWKVRTWSQSGRPGAWSKPRSFVTLPTGNDLVAEFIWDDTSNINNVCYARRNVFTPANTTEARVIITAHDSFRLTIDGVPVARGPAPADPYKGIQAQFYDVTDLLTPGITSTYGVVAQYHGGGTGCGVQGTPALLCQITFEHSNGQQSRVGTNATWKVLGDTPYNEAAPLRGPVFAIATGVEDYDARLEPDGWLQVPFNASGWDPATVVQPDYILAAQRVPLDKKDEYVTAVTVSEMAPQIHLVDFGQNLTGWPVLTLKGLNPGQALEIHYSDVVLPNGRIERGRMSMTDYYDRYVAVGGSQAETWEPDFKYQSFRYIEIEGLLSAPSLGQLTLRKVHTQLDLKGSFSSSEPLLTEIYDLCMRTQLNCAQGVLVDCPDREQSQYSADATIEGLNLSAFAEDAGFLRKLLLDLEHGQVVPGLVWEKAPTSSPHLIAEWTMHYAIALWAEYMLHDSPDTLVAHMQTLIDIVTLFDSYIDATTGLLSNVPGTSLSDHPLDPFDESGDAQTVLNCFYVNTLRILSKVVATQGQHLAGAAYLQSADDLKAAINANLFNGVDRYVDTLGSNQTHGLGSAIALLYDIVPDAKQDAVLAYIKSTGFECQTYGGAYLSESLWKAGEIEHLIDLTLEPGERWLYMIDEDSTTVWEGWLPLSSLCHAFSAYPLRYLPVGLMGVEPLKPGYAQFRVAPVPVAQLDWAQADIPTPHGLVRTRWEKTSTGLEFELTVPGNSICELHLPVQNAGRTILESGRLIWSDRGNVHTAQWIQALAVTPTEVVFELLPGRYKFETIDG